MAALNVGGGRVDVRLLFCSSIGVWDAPSWRFELRLDYEENILESLGFATGQLHCRDSLWEMSLCCC